MSNSRRNLAIFDAFAAAQVFKKTFTVRRSNADIWLLRLIAIELPAIRRITYGRRDGGGCQAATNFVGNRNATKERWCRMEATCSSRVQKRDL